MGKLVILSVYISFSPWLLELHFWVSFNTQKCRELYISRSYEAVVNFIVFEEDIGLKVIDTLHLQYLYLLSL